MVRWLDRVLVGLLALGGLGHALGSWTAYRNDPMTLLWALCATLLAWLLTAVHGLRMGRPGDRALATIAIYGTVAYAATVVTFGLLIGNPLDPRVVCFIAICLGLILISAGGMRYTAPE